jgi:hypothetical protein
VALDFPASPTLNQTFPGPNGVTWSWDGAKWTDAAVSGSPPGGAVIAATPPAVTNGSLWWDSTGGQLYVGFNDGNSTQWVVASNIPGLANAATKADVAGALANVGRNLIHNSMFNIAQRGAGPFTTANWALDRYLLQFNGGSVSGTQFALSDADRAQIGDEAAVNGWQCVGVGTAGAGDYTLPLEQHLESIRRLAGKTVTVSFYAKATAGTPKLGIEFQQVFGSGGSPSTVVNGIGSQAFTLSTTWTRYTATVALPSASGKTFGTTAGTDYTMLRFYQSAGATLNAQSGGIGVQSYTLQLWGVQCEVGSQATPLEKLDPRYDLANCQRFYQTGFAGVYGYANAGAAIGNLGQFPVTMRASPTMAIVTPTYGNASAANIVASGFGSYQVSATVTAAGNASVTLNYTASADL